MNLVIDILLNFAISVGFIIFASAVGGAIYNNYLYNGALSNFLTGLFFGLFSLLFCGIPFIYQGAPLFDYRFVLLILVGMFYNSSALLWMAPAYLAGICFTYSDLAVGYPLYIAVFSIIYCLLIRFIGCGNGMKNLLLIAGTVLIVFSEPLVSSRVSVFTGKLIYTYAAFAVLSTGVLFIAFTNAIKRNFFGALTLAMYLSSLFSKYNTIYHFVIDRKRRRVKMPLKLKEDFEFTSPQQGTMEYAVFKKAFLAAITGSYAQTNDDSVLLSSTLNKYIFVTGKTSRRKYISYVCKKSVFGGYSCQLKDITDTIEPEEILQQTMRKNHITGFKTYYVMKEEIIDAAEKNPGLMLQLHFVVHFTNKQESLFGYEFENDCFRFIADLLRKEFPEATIYSVKENEFQILIYNIERTDNARPYADRLLALFRSPYDLSGRRFSCAVTAGVLVSEALKCTSIEYATQLVAKAIYAKDRAYQNHPGSVYYYNEDEYQKHLEQYKRSEILPGLIMNGDFYSVFQPIVSASDGSVFAYEVLTRIKNNTYKSTAELISDSYLFGLDRQLDVAIIKGVAKKLAQEEIPYHLFLNKLMKTPVLEEFSKIASILRRYGKDLYVEFSEYQEYDVEDLKYSFSQLTAKGVKIAIDDYGKGYSSQSMVSNIHPSVIKIDMELIREIDQNKQKEVMVKGIVEYCDALGIKCLAEGISCSEELAAVIHLGVHYLQGFYLGKPSEQPFDIPQEIKSEILALTQEAEVPA